MSNPSSRINQRLGNPPRYRLDQCLGSGSFGDVFLAMDLRLGRRVAVKILKGALAKHRDLLLRFEREVALSVALESEHIVQVMDYGVALDEDPFYVMEYLQGQTLSQLLKQQGYLSVEQAVAIVVQICAGLGVAHTGVTLWKNEATVGEPIKIIHRDLKPANIFLIPTPLGKLVKILDFGIAKKLHLDKTSEHTKLTQAFLGTFRYAAPEQLRNAWALDERADIYSLGMIFYEMLSGTDPFGISAQVAPRRLEQSWAMAHASITPTPLRQQPNCGQISTDLEAAVMRCLAKSPDQRFASVAELCDQLHAIQFSPAPPLIQLALEPTVPYQQLMQPLPQNVRQDTTIYRPIAQYVEAQAAVDGDPAQPAEAGETPLEHPAAKQTMLEPSMPNPPSTEISGKLPTGWPFPPDTTIVQIQSPQQETISETTCYQSRQKQTPDPADYTIVQGAAISRPARQTAPVAQSDGQHHPPGADGLLERARAWLQSSASNYTDRLQAQASAEVRYAAYRLLARLLPASIGFMFGIASLSGVYFLLRGLSPQSPSRSIPSQIK